MAAETKTALEQKDGKTQATKYDYEKVLIGAYPARALVETCKVFTFGAKKYSVGNWHHGGGFDWMRLFNAQQRHLWSWALGEDQDPESLCHILAHAACCNAMLLDHVLSGHGTDDRAKYQWTKKSSGS